MTWVLILLFQSSVGPAAALTSVAGFATKAECEQAGKTAAGQIGGGHQVRWSCVSQGAEPAAKR